MMPTVRRSLPPPPSPPLFLVLRVFRAASVALEQLLAAALQEHRPSNVPWFALKPPPLLTSENVSRKTVTAAAARGPDAQ